jgi:hypothetical protein
MHQATSRAGGGFTLLEVRIAFDTGAVMIVTIHVLAQGIWGGGSRTESVVRLNARPRGLPYENPGLPAPGRSIAATDGPAGLG